MSIIATFKDILIETLKERKKLIIILYVLMIISFIISWIIFAGTTESIMQAIQIAKTTTSAPVIDGTNPIVLFSHNAGDGIITYLCSIFFGIYAIFIVIYNGVNLGMLGPLFSAYSSNGGLKYIIYLIPHGIFEFTGTVIQSTAGILLFIFLWRFLKSIIKGENGTKLSVRESFEKNKKVLIQSIVLLIFATILMLIAAPIEAYISIPFSEWIVGYL